MDFNEQTIDKLDDLLMIGITHEENKMRLSLDSIMCISFYSVR